MASAGLAPALLSSAQRASLFRAVARLDQAGVPAARAVAAMADLLGAGNAHRFHRMSAAVSGGASLTEAGSRVGLFSPGDRELIRLAERSGTLSRAADRLADSYKYRARVYGKLRSRMMLPLLVLVLGLFLLPLPSLLGGQMGASEFVWRTLGPLVALVIAVGVGRRIVRRTAARGVPPAVGRLSHTLPVFAQASPLQLVEDLALMLDAGVPAREALEAAVEALGNPAARSRYGPAVTRLESQGMSSALSSVGALEADEFAIVSTSETAGRLSDGIERVAAKRRQALEHHLDVLSEWLPRAVYLLVVAIIAAGLIG